MLLPLSAQAQSEQEKKLFEFINADREQEGLQPLDWDPKLEQVAEEHSRDMAEHHQISHTGSDKSSPQERIRKAGVFATRTAENVARDLNIVSAHTALMESVYHRENILDPEMTDAAVGIERDGMYLYVTEVFIRGLAKISLEDAREILLNQMNRHRASRKLPAIQLSRSLSAVAQAHIEVQENLNTLSPPLLMNLLAKKEKGAVRINIFTSATLGIPGEVKDNLNRNLQQVGIGFKRIRGKLCESGCYLVTLIFSSPQEKEPSD